MSRSSIARHTLRALVLPKRLVPMVLVCVPLVVMQYVNSTEPWEVPLALVMCLCFVSIGPLSWRVLFPDDTDTPNTALRLLLYAAIGAGVLLTVGVAIPRLLGLGTTFLTQRESLAVCGALFLVGGWGLGRDIGLEASLTRERARGDALAREAEQAQLLALRAHLDPHFLFNTLNAIAEWCREDGATAERAVLQLSSMLRTLLHGVRSSSWPLAQELELARTLFALHHLRSPSAFRLVVDVDEAALAVEVPPLVLLPLAENAVKHGPSAGHHGEVRLSVTRADGHVRIVLENPGPYRGPRVGSEGLPTVQRRVALAYGGHAALSVGGDAAATRAELVLPTAGPLAGVHV